MILMIDNYDSFTYNLVQLLGELGEAIQVFRNDKITLDQIEQLHPDHIVISPGPCTPDDAGISLQALERFSGQIPILGVCLGHQAIAQAFGGTVIRSPQMMHGKTSFVYHDGCTIFSGIESPFTAMRYHSLTIEHGSLPDCLEITAWTEEGEIMGVRHRGMVVEGVQFHPESIMTDFGKELLANFLRLKH